MVIGIETDRGMFAAALVAAGYQVFAVNPMSVSRYRDRHSSSGAKSDPGDAKLLADLVRTDRHNHRPAVPRQRPGRAVKVLARAHQSMIWNRAASKPAPVALRSPPRRPGRVRRSDQRDALAVLQAAPGPPSARACRRPQIAAALRRAAAARRISERPPRSSALRAPQLQASPVHRRRDGTAVASLAAVIAEMTAQIAVLEQQLSGGF